MRHAGEAEGQTWDWQDGEVSPLYQECPCKELELRAGNQV